MARTVRIAWLGGHGFAAFLVAAFPLLVPVRAAAVDITVTTTVDEVVADGDCSLREAVRAANLNGPIDACPAGSLVATDTVILADGATYSLGIAGSDTVGLVGDLNVVNNPNLADDLIIEVANGGTATISQDASPDDQVLDVAAGAGVVVRNVVFEGGGPAGLSGGAVVTGTGSTVTFEGCSFVGNVAGNNGGAISNGGTLLVDACVFTGNVAPGAGGAIIGQTGSSTTVTGSRFEDNVTALSGGAIRGNGTLSVSGTTFVANRAASGGGAVFNSSTTAGAMAIESSCFAGNADAAVETLGTNVQSATGSWWGASDGPSGAAPGSGDAVDTDVDVAGFASAPLGGCRPMELVLNHDFDLDDNGNLLPDRWRLRRLQAATDGRVCGGDGCVLQMNGDGQRNQALQTMLVSGAAGESVTIRAGSSADAVPTTIGKYLVELTLIHGDGSKQRKTLKFSPGTHGVEELAKTIVAAEPFVRLKVRIEYARASGVVQFDQVSVVLE